MTADPAAMEALALWLAGVNTTAEAVARYCWETLAPSLTGVGLTSLLVRVWESPCAYAARDDLLTP